jgi:hypothetical protein
MSSSTESHDATGERGSVLESLSCSRFKIAGDFNSILRLSVVTTNGKRPATWITSSTQTIRRFSPAHKENKHEAGRTKKLASSQEAKEAPRNEEIYGGEEIKGVGSVKIED